MAVGTEHEIDLEDLYFRDRKKLTMHQRAKWVET